MRLVAIVPQETHVAALFDQLENEGFNEADIQITELDDRENFRELDQNIDYQQFGENNFLVGLNVPDNKVDRIKDLFEREGVREIWFN